MNSYLSLIPISAKVQRRQNYMTLLCIIFAVFLVTAVFSMAEIGVKMEQERLQKKHGAFTVQDIINSEMGQILILTAVILFVLILLAGILMISSSINSFVTQRTNFFGMMRCIGMSRQQIIHFVSLEALNWCKTAVPIGVLLGIVVTWGLCAVLRFFVLEEFSNIPIFSISSIGIVSGITMGIVTVLIAARSPAKRAAKVSPVQAVSGNLQNRFGKRGLVNPYFFKIETALGIEHAVSSGKNLILMTASFALSIILFLSFSVLIDFVGYLMPQLHSTADIEIRCNDGSNSLDRLLVEKISAMKGVKRVYGRRSCLDFVAELSSGKTKIDIVSFDNFDLDCLVKDDMLIKGSDISKVYGDSSFVLATFDKDRPLEIGDKIWMDDEQLEIAGLLKYDPFSSDGLTNGKVTIITSSEVFTRLTGTADYLFLMIQTAKNATDQELAAISGIMDENCTFKDIRSQNTGGTYKAFVFCVFAFLAVITLVSVLNIVNSISMSVSARTKQYGAMRAVGMNDRQLAKMISAEAFTYALSGGIVGCSFGLLLSKLLYDILIVTHFSYAVWNVPVTSLLIILSFISLATVAAVYTPVKRMRNMAVTEAINEL